MNEVSIILHPRVRIINGPLSVRNQGESLAWISPCLPYIQGLRCLPWQSYLCWEQPIKEQLVHLKVLLLNQWACCHGRLTRGAIDDDSISSRIWTGKGEERLNEIPSILMKYNYILLINHLRINMSLLGEPHENLSFHARPQYILSCSDFYKFSHLCPRVNNSVFSHCWARSSSDGLDEGKPLGMLSSRLNLASSRII